MKRCFGPDCSKPVSKGRIKYCSSKCQMLAARRLTKQWRARRDEEEALERLEDRPASTRRYAIRGGTQLWSGMYDESLVSNRNPTGSKYVQRIIDKVDSYAERLKARKARHKRGKSAERKGKITSRAKRKGKGHNRGRGDNRP